MANGNGENGNGNGASKWTQWLAMVFFTVVALVIQAMRSQADVTDLKLQLQEEKSTCKVRLLELQREHDKVDFEKFEEEQRGLKPKKE